MKLSLRFAAAIPALVIVIFPICTSAQRGGAGGAVATGPPSVLPPTQVASEEGVAGAAAITVHVYDENGIPLVKQALVTLSSDMGGMPAWATTGTQSEAIFSGVTGGSYTYEVSAAGYKTAKRTLYVFDVPENYQENVTLVSDGAAVAPPLTAAQILAPKVRKEAEKGITSLKAGNFADAEKHLQKALKLAPGDANVNFLLGYLYMQKRDLARAQAYLNKAVSLDPKQVRALTTLGQIRMAQNNYAGAASSLEAAIKVDPNAWQAHWFLADAYLALGRFEDSHQQAQLAIDTGKGAAKGANLILGQALGDLGHLPEAIVALQTFTQDFPKSAVTPQALQLIARLKTAEQAPKAQLSSMAHFELAAATRLTPMGNAANVPIPGWAPPDVDDEKPVLSSGAACPADRVIEGASKRAAELVDNISSFGARETMLHEDLDEIGGPLTKETRRYNYIADISEPQPGLLMIDEYRTGLTDATGFPDHIATIGVPALAMVFHPDLRGDFDMVCEGLGEWKGQATWLVHFRQKPDRPSRVQTYEFSDGTFPVAIKGRAWIAAGTFQIVHIETDLVEPMPKIQLLTEHQSVDYAAVEFKQKKLTLWLPKQADMYFEFRRHRYYRRHTFDDYMFFAVGSRQKIQPPKTPKPDQTASAKPDTGAN